MKLISNKGKIWENVDEGESVFILMTLAFQTKDYIIFSYPRNTAKQIVTHTFSY
jgi:hypothetical protein